MPSKNEEHNRALQRSCIHGSKKSRHPYTMEIRCVGVCYCLANIYPPHSLCHEKNIISCSINIGLALATGTWTEVTKDQFSA